MSVSVDNLKSSPVQALLDDQVIEVRELERYKWFARQLGSVASRYEVAELAELLDKPAQFPGHREKVIVMLSLHATPDAVCVLEQLEPAQMADSLRKLHHVALRVARASRTRRARR